MILTTGDKPYKMWDDAGYFNSGYGLYSVAGLPANSGYFTPEILRRCFEGMTQDEFNEIVLVIHREALFDPTTI